MKQTFAIVISPHKVMKVWIPGEIQEMQNTDFKYENSEH